MQVVRESGLKVHREANGYAIFPAETVRQFYTMKRMQFRPTVATIGMQKGGVGKSLLTLNTALAGAQKGARVLVVDLDPEACATQFLTRPEFELNKAQTILEVIRDGLPLQKVIVPSRFDGISFVPCRASARRADALAINENPATLLPEKIKKLLGSHFDLVLFDVPPNFGNLISSAYLASEVVVCPVNSDVWSLESLILTIEDITSAAKKWRCRAPTIRVVRNKVAPPQRRDRRETDVELAKEFATLLLDISFKASSALSNAINDGISIFDAYATIELRSSFLQLFDYLCPLERIEAGASDNKRVEARAAPRSGAVSEAKATKKITDTQRSAREARTK